MVLMSVCFEWRCVFLLPYHQTRVSQERLPTKPAVKTESSYRIKIGPISVENARAWLARQSASSDSPGSPALGAFHFFGSFLICRVTHARTHTHICDQSSKETTWSSVGGLMVTLKPHGNGTVVIPDGYKAVTAKVIAVLISTYIKLCIWAPWAAAAAQNYCAAAAPTTPPLPFPSRLASPSNGPSQGRLWSQRAVYSLIMLFHTITRVFHMCYLCISMSIEVWRWSAVCQLKWSAFEVRIVRHYRGSRPSDVQARIRTNACD